MGFLRKKYDFFTPGIRGYLQDDGWDVNFDLDRDIPNLDITFYSDRKNFNPFHFLEPTTASRMLYVFGLLLEEDENRYNKKILSLNDTQEIDRLKKFITPKWVDNNKIIFKMGDKLKLKYCWDNGIHKNLTKLVKKIYPGKSKFIKEKLEISLKFLFYTISHYVFSNYCHPTRKSKENHFVYMQWHNKKERQVLVCLIKNDFFQEYIEEINFHYYYRTGIFYKNDEYIEQIEAIEIIRKSYFDNTPLSIEEFNKTFQNSRIWCLFVVDLNREDFLQKTLWGRIQNFFRSKIDDRQFNQDHLESYISKRYFGV